MTPMACDRRAIDELQPLSAGAVRQFVGAVHDATATTRGGGEDPNERKGHELADSTNTMAGFHGLAGSV